MTDLMFYCPACGAALIAHPVVNAVEVWYGEALTASPNGPKGPGYVSLNIGADNVRHDCASKEAE